MLSISHIMYISVLNLMMQNMHRNTRDMAILCPSNPTRQNTVLSRMNSRCHCVVHGCCLVFK